MNSSARQAMKVAIIALLNASLKAQNLLDVKVVSISDDFEISEVMHKDGTVATIKSELILPEEAPPRIERRLPRTQNHGTNAYEVARVRHQRVNWRN